MRYINDIMNGGNVRSVGPLLPKVNILPPLQDLLRLIDLRRHVLRTPLVWVIDHQNSSVRVLDQ